MSAETKSTENTPEDTRAMIWWDIDNTLYSANTKISQAMGEKIRAYFMSLGLDDKEAADLHLKYYTQYGLALAGLVRHHNVDPIDFDKKCDGSLPLESMISPNAALRQLFLDIDRSKARVWALTNAYRPHAERVLKILQLDDLVEEIVFCDYAESDFTAKPEHTYYHKKDPRRCTRSSPAGADVPGFETIELFTTINHHWQWMAFAQDGVNKLYTMPVVAS